MKNIIRSLALLSLMLIISLIILATPQPSSGIQALASELVLVDLEKSCAEFGTKIDLNNANIIAFQDCRRFYPNLAKKIVLNGPYEKVEDVLEIPGLSERQKELLKSELVNFEVKPPVMRTVRRMPPKPEGAKMMILQVNSKEMLLFAL